MTYFTGSPYERMMTQVPTDKREALGPPSYPSEHPCCGCPYGRDAPCLGTCYRKLTQNRRDTNPTRDR